MLKPIPHSGTPSTPRERERSRGATPPAETAVPEWTTEEWKHRVEAEARHRLKREIRGVGARR
jgi:hypothetical protein